MTAQSTLKVFATHPHECSYLPDQEATTLFIDPDAEIDQHLYSLLSQRGFRRSGPQLYKPFCQHCSACIPVRIPVKAFQPKRQQRKTLARNCALIVKERDSIAEPEYYQLYERYINERHHDGDMFPASREQFDAFLTSEWGVTRYFCFYDQDRLLAVAVSDLLEDGLSAIYTFYDPDQSRRSLGVYSVLWQIEAVKQLQLDYLYLGYWIKECPKMSYKSHYRPIEGYLNEQWRPLN